MKHFKYQAPGSYEEAGNIVREARPGTAAVMAGGTDLLGVLKGELLPEYPETIVALRDIPDTDYIKLEDNLVKIGSMTRLAAIEKSGVFDGELRAVSQAAHSVASPLIRNRATIGGNLCQDVRCWFYRFPDQAGGTLDCMRKGGSECYAIRGDNRYHSIFGGMKAGITPCSAECPANTDIPAYMARYRAGDMEGAARILMQANPLPMMTSRVCAHTCQVKCNRCSTDEAVAIHSVERVVGDYVMEHLEQFYSAPKQETGKKIALVGAGPAGLTAAYYLRQAGHSVKVYEAQEEAGGCLMYAIPNFRLPKMYVRTVIRALEQMGVQFACNAKLGENVKISELTAEYDKVFIATGAWKRPVLGFDGEEFTEFGLQFLVDVNKWVNSKERNNVLVVGGGNVSMDVAITAKRLGAKRVTLCCLEQCEEMPASAEEIARAEEEGIEIRNGWGPVKALYDGSSLNGMELKACTALRDETGRFNPSYDENVRITVDADSILLATGQRVDLSFLENELELAVNRGLISVESETQRSSDPKVYAGGDAVTGPTTVIKAIASGRRAAEAINNEMGGGNPVKTTQTGLIHFDPATAQLKKANNGHDLSAAERCLDREDSTSLTAGEGLEEAKRCMNCGCYSVNASDLSPVMVALDANIKTSMGRLIPASDFFCTNLKAYANLEPGELIEEIDIPVKEGYRTGYEKFRMRPTLDFAMAALSWAYKMDGNRIGDIRLVLGAVAPVPLRLPEVEQYLIGKEPSARVAEEAGELAVKGARSIGHNDYKIDEIRTFVRRLVESMI
ncbi:FAD-dependent oxidoreductase [Enterocloster lavalensis]|uniref:FAD-dependent oxidoreductase n=1 Tax=Enterocloster lavalensis TaxID=460384 RepID=UPI00266664F9|nr:FAD-dependent oxidoreductase [Enterocloster lavalensis]